MSGRTHLKVEQGGQGLRVGLRRLVAAWLAGQQYAGQYGAACH